MNPLTMNPITNSAALKPNGSQGIQFGKRRGQSPNPNSGPVQQVRAAVRPRRNILLAALAAIAAVVGGISVAQNTDKPVEFSGPPAEIERINPNAVPEVPPYPHIGAASAAEAAANTINLRYADQFTYDPGPKSVSIRVERGDTLNELVAAMREIYKENEEVNKKLAGKSDAEISKIIVEQNPGWFEGQDENQIDPGEIYLLLLNEIPNN